MEGEREKRATPAGAVTPIMPEKKKGNHKHFAMTPGPFGKRCREDETWSADRPKTGSLRERLGAVKPETGANYHHTQFHPQEGRS